MFPFSFSFHFSLAPMVGCRLVLSWECFCFVRSFVFLASHGQLQTGYFMGTVLFPLFFRSPPWPVVDCLYFSISFFSWASSMGAFRFPLFSFTLCLPWSVADLLFHGGISGSHVFLVFTFLFFVLFPKPSMSVADWLFHGSVSVSFVFPFFS